MMPGIFCQECHSRNIQSKVYYVPFHVHHVECGVIRNQEGDETHAGPITVVEHRGQCALGHEITYVRMFPTVQPKEPKPEPNYATVIDGFVNAAEDYTRRAIEREFRKTLYPKPTFILED